MFISDSGRVIQEEEPRTGAEERDLAEFLAAETGTEDELDRRQLVTVRDEPNKTDEE